jgi:twinkle protein
MIRRLNDLIDKVEFLISNPSSDCYSLGFPDLDPHYKVVLGATTYIAGIPSHGKTEWLFEMLIRLSEQYGFRHFLYSPESGTADEVYLELACKYLRKVSRENAFNRIKIDEFRHAVAFINEHFIVREMEEKAPNPTELLDEVKELCRETKIHTFTIDPWNELLHNFSEHGGRQDVYLEVILGNVRRFSRQMNMHSFIIAHPKTLSKNSEGKYDPPTAFEFSGGATWYAKAESILCVYRPFEFSETLYEQTYVDIIVQKAKPKKVGRKGVFEIDYDYNTGRYKSRHDSEPEFNKPLF